MLGKKKKDTLFYFFPSSGDVRKGEKRGREKNRVFSYLLQGKGSKEGGERKSTSVSVPHPIPVAQWGGTKKKKEDKTC